MPEITIEQLTNIAKQFTLNEYNIELDIPIVINNRLKSTLGRYKFTKKGNPIQIDISGKLLSLANRQVAIGVVKHEAVHFALGKLGKPNRDGDPYFEKELIRLGIPSSRNRDRAVKFVGEKYVFECKKCKRNISTTVKKVMRENELYLSSCCHSRLQYVETIIGDGTKNGVYLF